MRSSPRAAPRAWRLLPVLLLAAGTALAAEHVVETAHYRVHIEGTRAQADEAAAVLEAAWKPFEEHFGAAPELAAGERLTVRLLADRAAFEAAISSDDTEPPASAGGYYWPASRTAYLFRQPTVYFTRTLLLHEAAHQFHYLACAGNRGPTARWYTEGAAEYLSWHRWDGRELELAVVPGVTLKDHPSVALAQMTARGFDLGPIIAGKQAASRPVAWALYRYLATGGRSGKPLDGFDTFAGQMNAGGSAGSLFEKLIGSMREVQPLLVQWLRTQQTTWAPVFNEWEQTGAEAFRGCAVVVSACRTKMPATAIVADLHVPDETWWRGGLLLHFTDTQDYTVALLDVSGGVRVHRRQGGAWKRLHDGRLEHSPGARSHRLEAARGANTVAFRVDGAEIGAWELPAGPLGLALERSDLHFAAVTVR